MTSRLCTKWTFFYYIGVIVSNIFFRTTFNIDYIIPSTEYTAMKIFEYKMATLIYKISSMVLSLLIMISIGVGSSKMSLPLVHLKHIIKASS